MTTSRAKILSEYLSSLGKRGGEAGKGASKRRGTSAYYKRISKLAAKARAAKRMEQEWQVNKLLDTAVVLAVCFGAVSGLLNANRLRWRIKQAVYFRRHRYRARRPAYAPNAAS